MHAAIVHGGAGGTSPSAEKGCCLAQDVGIKILQEGGEALKAAVAVVRHMEDSGVFNAGVGSILRIDGETIQMDAAVATSGGLEGTLSAVSGVKNPVILAYRMIQQTSYVAFAGRDAEALARNLGLEAHPGPTRRTLGRYRKMMREINAGRLIAPGWILGDDQDDPPTLGSGDGALSLTGFGCDTVGAVTLDETGTFAVAASTGGSGVMDPGRVGDVPRRGAGFQVGVHGGVLATGIGEEIIRQEGSQKVYELLEAGEHPQEACKAVASLFPPHIPVGFVALTKEAIGIATNNDNQTKMASSST